jgi:hypothetical protein
MVQKQKTYAERAQALEDAKYQHERRLADARGGIGKAAVTDNEDPAAKYPHPKGNKWFMAVGIGIAVFLLVSFVYSLRNSLSSHKRPAAAVESQFPE